MLVGFTPYVRDQSFSGVHEVVVHGRLRWNGGLQGWPLRL
jgi:hypothetical protein